MGSSVETVNCHGVMKRTSTFLTLGPLLLLMSCTGLRIEVEEARRERLLEASSYTLLGERLSRDADISAEAVAIDSGIRDGMHNGMESARYRRDDGEPDLVLDYLLLHALHANEQRLDSPMDYQRSWRGDRANVDPTGSMDHTRARLDFVRELQLSIEVRSAGDGELLWKATARRDEGGDQWQAEHWRRVLQRTAEALLKRLPRR